VSILFIFDLDLVSPEIPATVPIDNFLFIAGVLPFLFLVCHFFLLFRRVFYFFFLAMAVL
jgi:hypothetical protein